MWDAAPARTRTSIQRTRAPARLNRKTRPSVHSSRFDDAEAALRTNAQKLRFSARARPRDSTGKLVRPSLRPDSAMRKGGPGRWSGRLGVRTCLEPARCCRDAGRHAAEQAGPEQSGPMGGPGPVLLEGWRHVREKRDPRGKNRHASWPHSARSTSRLKAATRLRGSCRVSVGSGPGPCVLRDTHDCSASNVARATPPPLESLGQGRSRATLTASSAPHSGSGTGPGLCSTDERGP